MSPSTKKHDVFISFRGEDTRKTFTSQLHQAFDKENIKTYIDYNLEKGDEIWPTLSQAIQDSHISVVVFSENYAGSKWCLDELLKILECRKHQNQVVIPVFYNTNPSDVRNQKGSYTRAFERYKSDSRNSEDQNHQHQVSASSASTDAHKVSEWKDALAQAGHMSGWESTKYRDDSELTLLVVKDIWQKLSQMYPNELKGLVEIDENNNSFESFLKEFPTIGIWGMGGIRKTTMAKKIFAKYFAQYDSVCFLEKVRKESELSGQTSVRNRLLSELLKREITSSDVHGHKFIQRRLSGKKVFIVLDDVDNAAQLEYLLGELGELGPDSRLIITTRNRHTISERVDKIYKVEEWNSAKSLELFS